MTQKVIYVAEDDPALTGLLQVLFKMHTLHNASFFSDGLMVYNKTRNLPPDLLLLDILLPNLSGLAISRLVKFEERYAHIPVLIMSSVTDSDIREQVKYVGADVFIPKPFQPDRLLEVIEELLIKK